MAAARLMLNKGQLMHIDKVGNGHNSLPVGIKQIYHGNACIQVIVYGKLTFRQIYTQAVNIQHY